MRIVIGVDDSPCSEAAVEFVRKATWPAGTRVTVVSVARPVVAAYSEMYVPAGPDLAQLDDEPVEGCRETTAKVERSLRDAGFGSEAQVMRGDPGEALLDAARAAR